MPAPKRRPDLAVIPQLLQAPQRFGFFQAVRLLDRWLSQGAPGGQGLSRVQFRNSLALSFPPSEIEGLQVRRRTPDAQFAPASSLAVDDMLRVDEVEHIELTPAFMGLLGVAGTLPHHYTETLAHRELYQKDFAPRAFMDVFSHRAVMLFFEAWRKHRLHLQFEANRRQHYLPMVLSLAGLGHPGLRDRLGGQRGAVADESLAYFAGTLQQRTRSPKQLQQMLQHYLGVPVKVEQFVGRWYSLPPQRMPILGGVGGVSGLGGTGGLGAAAILGRTATLGERVWQRDLRLRLVLGPLSHRRFQRFLPGGTGAAALKEMLTLFSGVSLEYEVNLRLCQADVQGCKLDSHRAPTLGRLGWDTFLQTRPANDDRADVRYDIHAAA